MTTIDMGIPIVRIPPSDACDRPTTPFLVDRFRRTARDLRVSITEKCSLRCTYCMPEQGLPAIPRDSLLTADEIARLVGIGVHMLGIEEVRFTGGEPLLRKDLADIVARCSALAPTIPLALTTNGVGLAHRASSLAEAGLTRVNISLDTVDREAFEKLTRRDRLEPVLLGIRAAKKTGFSRVKVNAVLMPETLTGAADLLQWCLDEGVELRFIEQMPLDADKNWARDRLVTARHLLDTLSEKFLLTETEREDPSAPSERWLVDGGPATVGIIASVTRSFCSDCDRTRLTAEGTIRSCLFSDTETDLRAALRGGASDDKLADLWRGAMWTKWAGHAIDTAGFVPPERSMGAIGG